MILTNSGYRYGSLGIGLGFPISNRLFLPNGTDNPAYDNADFYPNSANGNSSNFILMNSKSSDLGEDPAGGGYYDGWVVGQNNRAIATTIINAFPRRMMQNLLLVPGKDNIPIPIAGSYFTKLMDHTPGTLEPWSALITDGDGYIDTIKCRVLIADAGGGGGGAVWTNAAATTAIDVAGIPAGTTNLTGLTALQILDKMLYVYQPVSITNFSIAGINTNYEIGEIVGNGARQVTLTAANSANIVNSGVTISYSTSYGGGSGNLLTGVSYSTFPRTANIPSLSSSVVNSFVTFTATLDQTTGADVTSSDTTRWWSKLYYGKSVNQNTDSFTGNNLANGGTVLITSTSMPDTTLNFTDGPGYAFMFIHNNYTLDYFAIGATVQNSFTLISTPTITNIHGASAPYKVYRSNSPLNGSFNLTVGDH